MKFNALKRKRNLIYVSIIATVIISSVVTNVPKSYNLPTTNVTVSSNVPHIFSQYPNPNWNTSIHGVSVPGGYVEYQSMGYVTFDQANTTVSLTAFHNFLGTPNVPPYSSSKPYEEFMIASVWIVNETMHSFHGTLSTYVSNIRMIENTNATVNLPVYGPRITEISWFTTQKDQVMISFYDPVYRLSNGSLSYTPGLGKYSYTLSFEILTYEEFGIYKILENRCSVSFNFSFTVVE